MTYFSLKLKYFSAKHHPNKNYLNIIINSYVMLNKSGLFRRLFSLVFFLVGVFLLYLLIKYKWDVGMVVEYITNLIGK